jgi:transposase-like protein
MDPSAQFCPNFYCLNRGKAGLGNIRIHSRKERRFRCATCGKTFAATKNTPYYRLHKSLDLVTLVLTLLCHGCPRQAIVAAYGLDERTVADWQQRGGRHSQRFHELHVQQGRVDVQHVQADELWVKALGRKLWMAMALAVPSRLWLGGVVSRRRDGVLIAAVVRMVRGGASSLAMLVCVDGLASYVTAFRLKGRLPPQAAPRRPPGTTPAARRAGAADRPGDQALQRPAAGGSNAAGGAGQCLCHRGGAGADGDGGGDQHGVHRAAQRDLPRPVDAAGAPGPGVGARAERGGGDVAGGLRLQLLLGA